MALYAPCKGHLNGPASLRARLCALRAVRAGASGRRWVLVKVKLTRKLARVLNGIDVTGWHEGDVVELRDQDARLLIAEGWAAAAVKEQEWPTAQDRPPPRWAKKKERR